MNHWKRAGLAFASAFGAELIVAAALTLHNHSDPADMFGSVIGLSIFVIPGYLLSLPFVLAFNRINGWRLWVLAVIGLLIGPTIIGAWAFACKVTEGSTIKDFLYMGVIATAISLLTTTFYLTVLKLFSHPNPTPSS
jgi:hypothetical protein